MLAGENDIFLVPGMLTLAMRAVLLVRFQLRLSPELFFDGLARRDELRGGRTAEE